MSFQDWIVLVFTLTAIILYGVWKSRGQKNMDSYFMGNRTMPWYIVLLSIMGTQASAITFLSAPGQAYADGMRFVQYYFGLPLAMIVICIAFVPIFSRLKVITAYEFLEKRFDLKTRTLTSFLFLIQRGLSTGISIYAPSIILSSLLGWNIYYTNIVMGGLVIFYTMYGGTKAVSYTQSLQLAIIFTGMFLSGWMVVKLLPDNIGFSEALHVSGKMGKLNVIVTDFNLKDRYNIWSGVIGGFFLALSYFGTDQSQVGRYLTAKTLTESRVGLLMNGLVKVPMQFLIMLIGALVFVFYLYFRAPITFNKGELDRVHNTKYAPLMAEQEARYDSLFTVKETHVKAMAAALETDNEKQINELQVLLKDADTLSMKTRDSARKLIRTALPGAEDNDTNYIFLHFVVNNLPKGLVGLLIAIIFLASWGSIAGALNSLASSSMVDIYQRLINPNCSDAENLRMSKYITLGWGIFSVAVAMFATNLGSLIEAVNILGSLFYGTILGIFVVAFGMKKIRGTAVFQGAIMAEIGVVLVWLLDIVSFLWLNLIGCAFVMLFAWLWQLIAPKKINTIP
ncbi:sodium:solute symporter [Chitinophaga sp. SYP-B3965]|uniref:sodium:solute symporter family transporter n=1 Tax=Chitinophaga sp. SYP-B3965 TaxID=2663120 RepID=UPI0012998081|nr:sodium:solute symporter [Chitinophaga sp. SYP-B3965]MRG44531.1 sodium:solute symporter [Chitinophaga sp. SYP-B3965]